MAEQDAITYDRDERGRFRPGGTHAITKQNAGELQARSVIARKEKAITAAQAALAQGEEAEDIADRVYQGWATVNAALKRIALETQGAAAVRAVEVLGKNAGFTGAETGAVGGGDAERIGASMARALLAEVERRREEMIVDNENKDPPPRW